MLRKNHLCTLCKDHLWTEKKLVSDKKMVSEIENWCQATVIRFPSLTPFWYSYKAFASEGPPVYSQAEKGMFLLLSFLKRMVAVYLLYNVFIRTTP
jgi:hypothetical protein